MTKLLHIRTCTGCSSRSAMLYPTDDRIDAAGRLVPVLELHDTCTVCPACYEPLDPSKVRADRSTPTKLAINRAIADVFGKPSKPSKLAAQRAKWLEEI